MRMAVTQSSLGSCELGLVQTWFVEIRTHDTRRKFPQHSPSTFSTEPIELPKCTLAPNRLLGRVE